MMINVESGFSKYDQALNILKERLNELNKKCLELGEENPIEHIKHRIKNKRSIKNKIINKLNLDFTIENVENLTDIVGVRIVCTFKSDIIKIVNYIKNELGFKILDIRDYIKNPKDGYSSYHMIIEVPVLIDGDFEFVKAEIQVRTMAMDVLSSQSHKIMYKQNYDRNSEFYIELLNELQETQNFVNEFDTSLDNLYQKRLLSSIIKDKDKSIQKVGLKQEYKKIIQKYILALETLNDGFIREMIDEYYFDGIDSPIEHVKWRTKTLDKIVSKLDEKGYELTLENLENYINDIGAIKIVCSFLHETEDIIEKINNYPGFKILEEQDYINNPKESGYRSYHFTVAIPIAINGEITYLKIEIQVRTIIMDFWANVEHKMCFQKNASEEVRSEFSKMSNILWDKELRMDELSQKVKNNNDLTRKRIINI